MLFSTLSAIAISTFRASTDTPTDAFAGKATQYRTAIGKIVSLINDGQERRARTQVLARLALHDDKTLERYGWSKEDITYLRRSA